MDGQHRAEALTREFLAQHPVAWIAPTAASAPPRRGDATVASAGDAEVIEKLRSIGYIGEERMEARNNRGLIALDEGDVDGAIAQFEGAYREGIAQVPRLRLNLARAMAPERRCRPHPRLTSEILAQDAHNSRRSSCSPARRSGRNKYPEAEENLRRALRVDPSFALAHTKLGEVLQKEGRDDEALAEAPGFGRHRALSPVEYNAIGNIHRRHGRMDAAIEAYRDALRADPQYIGAYKQPRPLPAGARYPSRRGPESA
jgi:tetratricopeptide (TPR) repeat protein